MEEDGVIHLPLLGKCFVRLRNWHGISELIGSLQSSFIHYFSYFPLLGLLFTLSIYSPDRNLSPEINRVQRINTYLRRSRLLVDPLQKRKQDENEEESEFMILF